MLCLSLAGKALAQDSCDNSKSSQNKSVISYNNSGDLSDSSDSSDLAGCKDCGCHCHHNHFDFASLTKSFAIEPEPTIVERFSLYLASPTLQINSLKKPPKIVS